MKHLPLVLLAVAATLSSACRNAPSAQQPAVVRPRVELRQEWFPYSGFAGEVVAANRFAAGEGIDMKVVPGSEAVDPIKLVLSGAADYAVASSDLVIGAVERGAPLVAIGVANARTPTCFIVRDSSKIRVPRDFIGQRVGILPGTNTERVYALMMMRSGVDRAKVHEMEVPFDLATFVLGNYDVRPAFIYDEPVSLEQKQIGYRIIKPEDNGVTSFLGTVYFTRRDVIEKKRDVTQKLVNSLIKGWRYTIDHPDVAVGDLVTAFPTLNRTRELRSLELGKSYFSGEGGRLLWATPQQWQSMIDNLEAVKAIPPHSVSVDQVWDPRFVEAAGR